LKHEQREVWYEPHPVSPARKAELMAAGYRIVDALFAPPGWVPPAGVKAAKADDPDLDMPIRGKKAKVAKAPPPEPEMPADDDEDTGV
jgi:hypothetical protein